MLNFVAILLGVLCFAAASAASKVAIDTSNFYLVCMAATISLPLFYVAVAKVIGDTKLTTK